MDVAETIRDQINASNRIAFTWWGARNFVKDQRSLQFDTGGTVRWKGRVIVTLNGKDLYDVRFMRIRGINIVEDVTVPDVFVEALVDTINQRVC